MATRLEKCIGARIRGPASQLMLASHRRPHRPRSMPWVVAVPMVRGKPLRLCACTCCVRVVSLRVHESQNVAFLENISANRRFHIGQCKLASISHEVTDANEGAVDANKKCISCSGWGGVHVFSPYRIIVHLPRSLYQCKLQACQSFPLREKLQICLTAAGRAPRNVACAARRVTSRG